MTITAPPRIYTVADMVDRLCEGPLDGNADVFELEWLAARVPAVVVDELQLLADQLYDLERDVIDASSALDAALTHHLPRDGRYVRRLDVPFARGDARSIGEITGRFSAAVAQHSAMRLALRGLVGAVLEGAS